MSITIRIDQAVYDTLKAKAEPFVDTPNTVLRRLLGLDGSTAAVALVASRERADRDLAMKTSLKSTRAQAPRRRRRAKRAAPSPRAGTGTILGEESYEQPILRALVDAGGSATSREVTTAVGTMLATDLTEIDKAPLASGGIRWENRVQFVRLQLIEKGLMQRDAPRGIWAISDAGRELVAPERRGASA